MQDCIIVSQLEVMACVGVPNAEREVAQRLTVSLRIEPVQGFAGMADDIGKTIDYAAVCDAVRHEMEARPRHLIETLAEEIALMLLGRYPLHSVEVEVRKYILPATEYVAVRVRREQSVG
jgi:dihydroneopterin aldolase